ncbi:MAG: gamma-glutamyl-gamma-aminobutyrate hydrolase family protein [Bacteroidetes bacterium]|nr:gamma-glutamyl-gamma-aminobutyrate hydrolase family protein [Bacteroidota bacterium]
MRIVLTSTNPAQHQNYVNWLRRLLPDIDIAFLLPGMNVDQTLDHAHVLLPGGGDPDPRLYGKPEARSLCEIDSARDELEFTVIRMAVERCLPILGICRGLQVVNVALGGTLLPDLPLAGYEDHHRLDGEDRMHDVEIAPASLLAGLTETTSGQVNSAHHQGVDLAAPRLHATARAHDGTIEALEWVQPADKPFLLLLHWHPERLPAGHPLSDRIGYGFLSAS